MYRLNATIKEELIENAKTTSDFEDWKAGIGWADWMEDYTEAGDGEEPTEAEIDSINEVLDTIWKIAKNN